MLNNFIDLFVSCFKFGLVSVSKDLNTHLHVLLVRQDKSAPASRQKFFSYKITLTNIYTAAK